MDHLAADGKVLVISVYDAEISAKRWEKTESFTAEADAYGFRTLILVVSSADRSAIPSSLADKVYYSDYKTLVTLNRSNGGATYFSDGSLVCKWAFKALPDRADLEKMVNDNGLERAMDKETKGSLGFQGFLLYVFAVMLLL